MAYSKVTPEYAEQLKALVGEGRFFYGADVPEDYCHDEMPIYGKAFPEAVCEVESTEEVAAILKFCNEHLIPVTPRGAGTGLVGGAVPLMGGVIICTARMNKILEYDLKNLCVRTQVGVRLCDLAADAAEHGLFYPPDPGEKTATVGGNVSTNAGGMRAVKYGVTRDYVLGMTVVLPSGEIMKIGKNVCKTSTGYSLVQLMAGSEGTLGIITELTLKLILPFAELADAIAAVPSIKLANLDPQSIEFMGDDIIESSAAFTGNSVFPTEMDGEHVGACLLVTLVGSSDDELDLKMEKLAEVAEEVGAMDVLVVDTPSLKKDVWAARSSFLTAIEADTKYLDEMAERFSELGGQGMMPLSEVGGSFRREHMEKTMQGYIDKGNAVKADTLEELAEKMDVPAENLIATVKRYNEIVASGDDTDFGKRARLLTSVEKAPFYALKWGPMLLDVFGGAQVDVNLNVIGADCRTIPGLYAVGNAAGGMYAVDYPLLLNGNSYGRALAYAMQIADVLSAK